MRELSPEQIHLWQYPIGHPPIAQHVAYAMTLLSNAEKHKCAAFHFEKHRMEYALSHAMLRLVLSEYAPVRPEEWQFSIGEWGKPEISGPALDAPLEFNLSHTDGFIACVAGRVRELGVDVENMNRMMSYDDIANRFFAPVECEYLRSLPLGFKRDAFFRIWTLKEAYVKAQGTGIAIPLNSFQFRFSTGNAMEVSLEFNGESSPQGWSFCEFQPGVDHRISIGARRTGYAFNIRCYDAAPLLNHTS